MLPSIDVVKAVEAARKSSEFVQAVARAKAVFSLLTSPPAHIQKAGFKPLTPAQVKALKAQGNSAEDWKRVWVGPKFDPQRVSRCTLVGPVFLSGCEGTVKVDGVAFPRGISHATLSHCLVGRSAFIQNVRLIHRTVVEEGAVLFDVGTITVEERQESFANGLELLVAIETGGREVRIFAELTVDQAWVVSRSRGNHSLLERYSAAVEQYVKAASSPCNVIGPQAKVLHTPKVTGFFLGHSAVIDSAASVEHVTVLSAPAEVSEISRGAIVKSSILQWGAKVTTGAIVDSSLLTEHSHLERHGKVTHSILGPNTGVAEGEVTSALLGPFVGFHHQALLIAALWPEGKGNVGYGANIGSNHTAKAPDQEIWPGEGAFFGLGVNIKFPTDLTRSPYTIIASGVNMLPQKVEFPFSLINTPAAVYPGISPAYNELIPGWVLSDNIYMVKRNEGKYAKRNKAKRSQFTFEVFRPEIVDMMLDARRRLEVKATKELYTPKEIEGLGKNYLLEPSRKKGIEAYTFYIRYYALLGLKRQMESKGAAPNPRWEHERRLLKEEFPGKEVPELLRELIRMQERIAQDVQASKEKDDRRGAEVIEDYAQAHKPASEDSFVKETWVLTDQLKKEVQKLISATSTEKSIKATSGTPQS
jgi:hypothetical protein